MTSFPISVRELRVAARQRRTYVSRLVTASVSVLVFAWMLWIFGINRSPSGSELFAVFSWIAFVYCSFAGAALTADALSSEKRENTLGLLFLTDLKGHDVVVGKLMGTSLNCFFGLLAVLPVLAIPLIMGGVQLVDFWKVVLNLINTLFLSATVGLLISTFSRHALRATTFALLLMLIFGFGLAGLGELLRSYYKIPETAAVVELFSPFSCQQKAMSGRFWVLTNNYWTSLATIFFTALTFLTIACWVLPRTWQDKPDGKKKLKWRELWRKFQIDGFGSSQHLRTRLLSITPYYWVAGRKRFGEIAFLLFILVIACFANWIGWKVGATFGSPAPLSGFVFIWLWAAILAHVALGFRIAGLSTHRFSQDRKSGALELILSTPLTTRRIVRGNGLALIRAFAGPALAVALIHALFVWGLLEMVVLDFSPGMTAWELIRTTVTGELPPQTHGFEEIKVILLSLGVSGFLIAHDWFTLAWVGMWIGLKVKHARTAPWLTLALVLIPPWAIFSLALAGLDYLSFLWNSYQLIGIGFTLAVALTVFHNLILSIWTWRRLRHKFRIAVTDRTRLARTPRTWSECRRIVFRFALGGICIWSLVAFFYLVERNRGERAWQKFTNSGEAQGETFDFGSVIPTPVKDEQNFAAAPIFTSITGSSRRLGGTKILTYNQLSAINVNGQQQGWWGYADQRFGSWANLRPTDLTSWQRHFKSLATFPKAQNPQTPAQHILEALTKFEAELAEVTQAAKRPHTRFSIDYEFRGGHHVQYLVVLHNFADLFHLRASAYLAENNSNLAYADLQTLFRLGNALKEELSVESHKLRSDLTDSAIQIVWEGLDRNRWSPGQLAEIQETLKHRNLLSDFRKAVHGESIIHIAKWARIRLMIEGEISTRTRWNRRQWILLKHIYPVGWTYLHQIGIYRYYRETLKPIADPDLERVYPEQADSILKPAGMMVAFLDAHNFPNAFHELAASYARMQSAIHLAETACALERYRLTTGHLPESLDSLLPGFMERLRHDLVSGGPLKYRPKKHGALTLYQVGWNEKDDGGVSNGEADWVWQYRPKPD